MKSYDTRDLSVPPGGPEATRAMLDYVSDRSVALLVPSVSDGTPEIGSGLCFEIKGRCLLATAGHLLDGVASPDQIRVFPRGERGVGQRPVKGFCRSPIRDVAIIELDPALACGSRLRFLGLSNVRSGQRHDPTVAFFLHGYPSRELSLHSAEDLEPLSLGLLTVSVDPGPRPDNLLALEYPPRSEADEGLALVAPHGISGGGVWRFPPFAHDTLWAAEKARVVAIPTKWIGLRGLELAEPIEYWLDLIAATFPDLRALAVAARGADCA